MGLQRSPVQQFGGLNTVTPPYDLAPGEASAVSNVRYPNGETDQESISSRTGIMARLSGWANGAQTAAKPFDWGIAMPQAGTPRGDLVLFSDGDIFHGIPGLTAPPTITRLFDGGTYTGKWAAASHHIPGNNTGFIYMGPADSIIPLPAFKVWDGATLNAWAANFPSQNLRSLASWRGRLVGIGLDPARVYYTPVGSVDFAANGGGFIDIFDQSGSANQELLVHNNNLYLIKQDSLWMIYDPNNFANRLIAMVGSGHGYFTHTSYSCPVDRRMYWLNADSGLIYSSNGEVDLVIENVSAPLPAPAASTTSTLLNSVHMQMAFDPQARSIVINWSTVPGAVSANQVDEICLAVGKPGSHPIFRHTVSTRALVTGFVRDDSFGTTNILGWRPELLCSSGLNLAKVYALFDQAGFLDNDEGNAIPSEWVGGWMPVISEEPWERIRRVNMLYSGAPRIEVASTMDEVVLDDTVFDSFGEPALYSGSSQRLDRRFVSLPGPNKRGRYHRVKVGSVPSAPVPQPWSVSAVEFALRGGRGKK